ncbi:MAG: outer membrane protein assembly factor BamC [Sterolibacteriaceae bacterium]|uniref:Outer membrane protein assembly factor BamC n=1 Tax=Candidatus Methylophosphatis roskildensis TaxID=2899263 RepID=A0A9D7HLY1_9PROT|nr:outer membrane protein assembly factor BamC [Candidatus Methylophosphatis roskildensis]MBK7238125.1 outer membrane protein assembly factor BamC [Sterolibacteriaceae bacterium]
MILRRSTVLHFATCLFSAALLAGCGIIQSDKIDYRSSAKLPTLEIPPDLTQPRRDDRYAVPDVNPRGSATYSVYNAERAGTGRASTAVEVLPESEAIRVERAGTQRWLVVKGAPDKLWPVVKDFWQETGFVINLDLPDAGVMETDWAENRARIPQDPIRNTIGKAIDLLYSTPERDKFRTRLEIGLQPGTTEVYISHRGMIEIYPNEARDRTIWQPRPADPELEAEMLRRLMVRLGAEEERAKVAVAAGKSVDRARLDRGGPGAGSLELQEQFDRAWRRVGLALDRVGFAVEDRDRSQGQYFVRYIDPQADNKSKADESGVLSKLMFWRSDDKKKPAAKVGTQYRVQVKGDGESSNVQVLSRDGAADSSEPAKRLLSLLYEQLR